MSGAADVERRSIRIDGRTSRVEVHRRTPPAAVGIIVVSWLPNETAVETLRVCVESVRRNTPQEHELWIVDNHSPVARTRRLLSWRDVNVALNRTEPLPPGARGPIKRRRPQPTRGSYANGIGIEVGLQLLSDAVTHVVTLHSDVMAVSPSWLTTLLAGITDQTPAAGMRLERARVPEGVLHPLGCAFDRDVYRSLGIDFLPDLPAMDVGDRLTHALRAAGRDVHALRNTFDDPSVIDDIPATDPFREVPVDRTLDPDGNVIFLHLGRGTPKATGDSDRGLSAADWHALAAQAVLT